MTTPYTTLLDDVMPDLPMAPPTTIVVNAIRDAVIELCERSLCYRQELQQILVVAPVSTTTTAVSAQFATTITVTSITSFADGDTLTVELDDNTKWRGHVSGTPTGSTITLDGQLNEAVEVSAAVTKFVDEYQITLPTGYAMAKCLSAWLNDSYLEPMGQDDIDTEFNDTTFGWVGTNWRTDVSLPTRFYMSDDSTVNIVMPPDIEGNLRLLCALKPTKASIAFDSLLYERYADVIAMGAKGKLMMSPKKPYTDMNLGAKYQEQFNGLVAEAKIRVARGNTRAPLRTHSVFGLR